MSEVAIVDNPFDNMLEAVKSGNREDLMRLSGQADDDTPKQGLSRLNINYETETDDGHTLKKGAWKVYYDGEFVYADNVTFRPLVRTYEWSVWDQEEGKFASRSVQAPSLDYQFPDTTGGNKCGRLTKSEEEQLGEDHPMTLASRLATCNQVFYAIISMEGKTADGRDVKIEDYPVMTYFKKSGFRPAREAIEKLGRNTLMTEVIFELTTKRHKSGSVTYFTPVFTQTGSAELDEASMETMTMFLETIKASNSAVMNQHKEAAKAKASEAEVDLAADFK
jgi:hypothetical protein